MFPLMFCKLRQAMTMLAAGMALTITWWCSFYLSSLCFLGGVLLLASWGPVTQYHFVVSMLVDGLPMDMWHTIPNKCM